MADQKVVWITGASSGIGEALVDEYLKDGYSVILSARSKDKLEAISDQASLTYPGKTAVVVADLEDTDSLPAACEMAIQQFGHIDLLINNAGISQRSLTLETDISVYDRLMKVNYLGNIALTKALLPHFMGRGKGHVAVISSLVGKFGSPYRSGYAASKHALHGFYDSARAELHDSNIHFTIVCPGFIRTNVSVNALTADGQPLNQMDDAQAKGMSPERCAHKIRQAIKKRKNEVYIGGKEVYALYLKRFFPGIFARILPGAKVR
ncbi:SDR family oxidoreductase [Fulvivirga sedimenti]|uniref:SDR family oxidoreductase n=1 Tax=Fulvivirga sedimenti TaxID=2879465 RepID=A0A9X1L148_9BACT|nr:SDR family oxidoreductase [Fulvivirga sedimenti]MCA6075369.1 SDR family oxidoreductase [Fulvivirga sedimenti]MCA6076546.1 SDR family oxidoreductase [Fulvivirga sedimenti]MCA6077674.1 SDR family oxidoreductase [Fulvivirga sedimenti]